MIDIPEAVRNSIRAQLEALADARKAIDVAMKPFEDARYNIGIAQDLLLEPYGEVSGTCEGCAKLMFDGEPGHRVGEDSLIFCPDCGPTYLDWKDSCEVVVANSPDEFDKDEIEAARMNLLKIAQHLESGGAMTDKLPAYPL